MDVITKYWKSAYVKILLVTPCACVCAGLFWTVCKMVGLYSELSWGYIAIFDISQLIYLGIALFFICKIRKNRSYISQYLCRIKVFIVSALFIQYNFIMHLFPSYFVWECTFIFLIILAFLFDSKLMLCNVVMYILALGYTHVRNPNEMLPMATDKMTESIAFRIVVVGITAACICLLVFLAEKFLIQAQERNKENIVLLQRQLEHYREMEWMDKELRKFRHDIREHFMCMETLFANGQEEKLRKYFKELKGEFTEKETLYFTGNEIIDAIINFDLQHICKEDVKITVYGEVPKLKTVTDMDLCTLFSNLLSNAIASANRCSEETNAKIMICFSHGQQYFSILMVNTAKEEWNMYKQRKAVGNSNHGYGVKKIIETVEKYNGQIEQTMKEDCVSIQVYLPI